MLIRVCDLCGKPITGASKRWKIKRLQGGWEGTRSWINVDVHDECVERIMNAEKFNQLWEEAGCDSDSTTE